MSISALRRNHPTLKNRFNKYLDQDTVKTWVDKENDSLNNDIVKDTMPLQTSLPSFNVYYNIEDGTRYNNSIVINVERQLQGLYCMFPKYNYKTLDNDLKTHLDIYITCHKCDICIARRNLHIMKSIFAKFESSDVATYHLYKLVIPLDGLTATKITNKIRYRCKKDGLKLPEFLLHTSDEETVTYLLEGIPDVNIYTAFMGELSRISLDESLVMVGEGNKYRFMGKFHAQTPLKTSGLTQEEIKELSSIKPYKNKKCVCGALWSEHDTRGATSYDLYNTIKPIEQYEKDHELFKEKYLNHYSNIGVIPNGVEK